MRDLLLWFARHLDIHEAGHPQGPMTCSRYGHHKHLPLDLIKWYPKEKQ
jgi:hypothetical protein